MNTVTATAHAPIEVVDPARIDPMAWQAVPGCPGVRVAVLRAWDHAYDALIAYDPSAKTPGLAHTAVAHHIWVVSGSASIAGQRVVAGSYAFVAAGTAHPVTEVGPQGCTLLQITNVADPEIPPWAATPVPRL